MIRTGKVKSENTYYENGTTKMVQEIVISLVEKTQNNYKEILANTETYDVQYENGVESSRQSVNITEDYSVYVGKSAEEFVSAKCYGTVSWIVPLAEV